jgi:NitT/TauT family transport system substrate-binding protein
MNALMLGRAIAVAAAVALSGVAHAQDRVTYGTDWRAQAEHGGFYQAVATGIYQRRGLEVTIRQGGPMINHSQLLAAGQLDFGMAPNSFIPLNFAREKIPMVAVAALMQKDPAVIIAHPGQGSDTLAALKGKPIMIGSDTRAGWWLFLKARFNFTDDQIRPYDFNVAPFLADKRLAMQGYLTSETLTVQQQGVTPVVHLLADNGYTSYAAVIQTSAKLVAEKPDLVQRFVDASIEGWYSYLYGDPAPGNALIKRDNREMTDELIGYGIAKMKQYGIVDSGDSTANGIGAMTEARWRDFYQLMADQGLYPKDMDFRQAYTLRFVNKRVGIELRK